LNCQKQFEKQSRTKSSVKLTWSEKITVLSTFLESSLNFLSNNLENSIKFCTVKEKSGIINLNGQKHSLKEQSRTKSTVKLTWSEKITVLSTFLESSLNFLSNNLKKHRKNWYSQGENQYQSLNCQKHSLKEQSRTKSPGKPTWSEKMTVLSTFLESSLNFLSNNLKNPIKFGTVKEKSDI